MNRRPIPLLAVAFALALPGTASGYLPPGFIGISPQSASTVKDYSLMREAGIRSVRLPLNWSGVELRSPAIFERRWDGFDHDVKLAAEQGLRVFAVVGSTPDWVAPEPIDLPVAHAWQRRAWASFLRAAVERYGEGGTFWRENLDLPYMPVRLWEIWNEENIVSFASDTRPKPFAALLRIAGRTIHREEPGSTVIVGGFFGRPLQIPPNVGSGEYLSGLYRAGHVKPFFDGVALHPYVHEARTMGLQLTNLRRIMRRYGDGGTPLYVTELGWGSQEGPTRWQRGTWGQADELARAFSLLSARRVEWNVGGVWWFTWSDEGGNCVFCGSAGLLTSERRAKPSWYRFVEWTGGNADAVSPSLAAE